MSLRGQKGVGIPTVLLHEGEGLVVTVETRAGYSYRGSVESVEDSMNLGLKDVSATSPDGTEAPLDRVFIRGSQVLFVVFPDVLRLAPMFERLRKAAAGLSTAGGLGRGRQADIGARAASLCSAVSGHSSPRRRHHPIARSPLPPPPPRHPQRQRRAPAAAEGRCQDRAGRRQAG